VSRSAGSRLRKAKPLVEAGADFLAVCQAVWGADDTAAAVSAFKDVLGLAKPLLAVPIS
jgi:thiamine monophosphate synthase